MKQEHTTDIVIKPSIVINLDGEDEIDKIDEQVH